MARLDRANDAGSTCRESRRHNPFPMVGLAGSPDSGGDQNDRVSLKDHLTGQTGQVPQFAIHKCAREGILSLIASGAGVTVAPASSGFANTPGFAFVPIGEPRSRFTLCGSRQTIIRRCAASGRA